MTRTAAPFALTATLAFGVALALAAPGAARAEPFTVNPDAGNSSFSAVFDGVQVGPLAAEQAAPFTAAIPFTVCGRARADGGKEKVVGTAVLFPPGSYGERKTIRIRATIAGFDREAYRIGPRFTDGWLARVQQLAKVVAPTGTVELSLFAKAK